MLTTVEEHRDEAENKREATPASAADFGFNDNDDDDDDLGMDIDPDAIAASATSQGSGGAASSAPLHASQHLSAEQAGVAPLQTSVENAEFIPLLQQYYARLFPFGAYHRWLSYGSVDSFRKNYFANREFSFTLQNGVWTRYQSFDNATELKTMMQKLIPQRIEIGAVFTSKPRDSKAVKKTSYFPVEKELIFDIDMDAYDDIRLCCSGAKVCDKCWMFLAVAMKVIDKALREDFGFQHLMWVYSGRRGIHLWVCDDRARMLATESRGAIAEYLCFVKGGGKKLIIPETLHPAIKRAYDVIHPYFRSAILEGQDILRHPDGIRKMLSYVPDDAIREYYTRQWIEHGDDNDDDSVERWKQLLEEVRLVAQKTKSKALRNFEQAVILQYLYPRLDIEVSKQLNHLLKSPFCIHPSTGRVCIPINIDDAIRFNPNKVPTIYQVFEEIDSYDKSHPSSEDDTNIASNDMEIDGEEASQALSLRKISEYKKTSLAPSIDFFKAFIRDVAESVKIMRRKHLEEDMTF